jgi:hypothetical protein
VPATEAVDAAPPATAPEAKAAEPRGDHATSSPVDAKSRRLAQGLLRRHDKNKSGLLEPDEWVKFKGDSRGFDRDGNGALNVDELAAKLASFSNASPESKPSAVATPESRRAERQPSASGLPADRSRPRTPTPTDDKSRRSYRFLTARERLPKGIPSWFIEKDADADGQVAMFEYSTGWTEAAADEFTRYDFNGDGLISPAEASGPQGK